MFHTSCSLRSLSIFNYFPLTDLRIKSDQNLAQNATETQIKMFLTRIGENSKLVVNGDPSQVDLINKRDSGLVKSRNILKDLKEIKSKQYFEKPSVKTALAAD